ncbi:AraC family transcriptional regulator [Leptospira gomenensis]|uniref:AraC family transcriptional regulator n=1 Tax=Leptospira gomenensis TaxID=2484974 RepID=A0A5F1Z1W5_9LEPT|nr:helix-turn-helix domain-containing protein [Leptospira gomenensis]TGK35950.1 AraC family transcriptional regulator [Leptospira gomenensis]TGK40018.1 AraC family transcriptional regulator [Leptospira gomenensis]TGK51468.1 AraC family transcriptional regulator [Leptospira gomenensis]TGK68025.1 AraC family transcriptional regulator [Leptospira gomenensis]
MNTFIAFGAGLLFLLAISGFLNSRKNRESDSSYAEDSDFETERKYLVRVENLSGVLFFTAGIVQLHLYLELSDQLSSALWFFNLHIPAVFLIGPLTYLYFETLSGGSSILRAFHFFPALGSAIVMLPFYLRNGERKAAFLAHETPLDPFHTVILTLLVLGTISNLIYPIGLFRKVWRWRKNSSEKRPVSFLPFLFLFAGTVFVLSLFAAAQIFYMPLFPTASACLTILICSIFLMSVANPDLTRSFVKDSREARYKESRISGLDLNTVLIRLDELMTVKRLYLDENLTLGKLAAELDVQTHQLSEILNVRLGKSFREYVTRFRLEEAADLLLGEPERSILSVLYASGFNSKSSFHKLFQEYYGCSPSEFRNRESLKKRRDFSNADPPDLI